MNAITKLSRSKLRMLCLVVAGLVLTGLLEWQQASDSAADRGYSVTIEQLQ